MCLPPNSCICYTQTIHSTTVLGGGTEWEAIRTWGWKPHERVNAIITRLEATDSTFQSLSALGNLGPYSAAARRPLPEAKQMLVPCSWTSPNQQPSTFLSPNQSSSNSSTERTKTITPLYPQRIQTDVKKAFKATDSSRNSMTHPFFKMTYIRIMICVLYSWNDAGRISKKIGSVWEWKLSGWVCEN